MTPPDYSALESDLARLLGPRGVSSDLRQREKASVDGARMSPIIAELLPLGLADLVVFPTSAEQVGPIIAAAKRQGSRRRCASKSWKERSQRA